MENISVHELEKLVFTNSDGLKELSLEGRRLYRVPDNVTKMTDVEVLNLSNNYLRELPRDICHLFNLRTLLLIGNKFKELPSVIGQLTKLVKLDVSENLLITVSDEITKLEQLQELNLSRNRLEGELPLLVICQVKSLIKLNVSRNQLTSIPDNITKLEQLQELNLNRNILGGELPAVICQLKSLIKLKASGNQLTSISDNITKLEQLQELDLSRNGLTNLPEHFFELKKLTIFFVDDNHLRVPREISREGLPAIRSYFLDGRWGRQHLCKLVLLGSSGAGKTSLAQTLVNREPSCVQEEDRTIVVDRTPWKIDLYGEFMKMIITDFGGNHWYKIVHHLFLDENALILLVVNLARYAEQIFDKEIGSWLNVLMSHVPKARIILVGTQIDRLETEERIRLKITQVFQDVSSFVKKVSDQIYPCEKIIPVSCKTLRGIKLLRKLVYSFAVTNAHVIPSCWSEVYRDLQNSKTTSNKPFLTFNAVKDLVKEKSTEKGFQWLVNSVWLTKERRAETVLSFFHSVGALLWYKHSDELKKFVFHKVNFLVELMKDVFSERLSAESLTYQGSFKELFTSVSFQVAKKDLLERGIMSRDLLRCLWSHCNLEEELFDALTKLFVHLDLCYPMNQGVHQSPLRFPWFLTQEAPETQGVQRMLHARPPHGSYRLSLNYVYPAMCPEPLYHIFVVRLHRHVQDIMSRHDWKDGLYAWIQETQVLVHRSHEATETVISVSSEGSDLLEAWTVLLSCHKELTGVMSEWPGIRWECWIVCPHCKFTGRKDHGRFPASNLDEKCPKGRVTCDRHDERIPACLVYPVGDDFSRHQKVLEEYTNQLVGDGVTLLNSQGSVQITSFKTGSPSPEELGVLAQEVCSFWKALGKQLCLTDADLSQIEADNQGLCKQCYSMLKRWTQVQASPPTYENLARALGSKLVERGDLAVKYCSLSGKWSREVCSTVVKEGTPPNEVLEELAAKIGDSWKTLGRRLQFHEAELTAFHKENEQYSEKAYKMLLRWKERNGADASYQVLHEALCHHLVSRRDLAAEFC